MREKLKHLTYSMEKANPSHASILLIIGGYLMYLAWMILKNFREGKTTMSAATSYVSAGVMALMGLLVLCYSLYVWKKIYQKNMEDHDSTPEENLPAETPSDGDAE